METIDITGMGDDELEELCAQAAAAVRRGVTDEKGMPVPVAVLPETLLQLVADLRRARAYSRSTESTRLLWKLLDRAGPMVDQAAAAEAHAHLAKVDPDQSLRRR